MESLYPASPEGIPQDLTAPSALYRKRVATAVLGLALFFAVYAGLTGWLGWVTYRGFHDVFVDGDRGFATLFAAIPAGFLVVFLIKGLFAVKRASLAGLREITAEEEPELVAFIHRVADEARAPRPAHIYLSDRVNAAVFYDAGLKNLFVPTQKNLEIGLGLINTVTLDEFKAVMAHEFGHFGQSAMGVGRWVYVSQQFVGDMIARRDALDRFLAGLSRVDLRVAWAGWLMRLLVWSVRAVIEQAFRFVVALSRALGRQMELQADLVAVSLSGSDSLVNALYRLSAADEAWAGAADMTARQATRGKAVEDLFSLQSRMLELHREMHADPDYGRTPARPGSEAADHRVFSPTIAETPRMWQTHPPNHVREEGCKERYVPSSRDERSAWTLFHDPDARRREMTRDFIVHVLAQGPELAKPLEDEPIEETMKQLEQRFDRPRYNGRYQGLYRFGGLSCMAHDPSELASEATAHDREQALARASELYPEAIRDETKRLGELADEKQTLEALEAGYLEAPGGLIVHRGEQLGRRELPSVIERVTAEWKAARRHLFDRTRHARGTHIAIARQLGGDWEKYLRSLSLLLHYAEHCTAEVDDAGGYFEHELMHALADGNVSSSEMKKLLLAGDDFAVAIKLVYDQREFVRLPPAIAEGMNVDSWDRALPEHLGIFSPVEADLAADWIGAARTWVDAVAGAFDSLAAHTLDVLVETEEHLVTCLRDDVVPGAAPSLARVPSNFQRRIFGDERPRKKRLSLWDRFQLAEGIGPATLRFSVASAILVPALVLSMNPAGSAELVIYNGLSQPMVVHANEQEVVLAAESHQRIDVEPGVVEVTTRTTDGDLVETFGEEIRSGSDQAVYNVASAGFLVRWYAVYGSRGEREPNMIGPVRWIRSHDDYVFETAPASVNIRGSGEVRSVMEAAELPPRGTLELTQNLAFRARVAEAHARWDAPDGRYLAEWMGSIEDDALRGEIISERADADPSNVRLQRLAMDLVDEEGRSRRCAILRSRAEAAAEDDAASGYLATRCLPERADRVPRFAALHERFPEDPWLANAVAHDLAARDRFEEALAAARVGFAGVGAFLEVNAALMNARLLRVVEPAGGLSEVELRRLALSSPQLADWLALEGRSTDFEDNAEAQAFWHLADGELVEAAFMDGLQPNPRGTILALAAASDGAPPELVAEALEDEAVPNRSAWAWARLGLQLREGRDLTATLAAIEEVSGPDAFEAARAIRLDELRADPASLEPLIEGLDLWTRASARLAASVALGESAPAEWRHLVQTYFFIHERPYLASRE